MELTIAAVNPLDHEEAIKQLFVTHERPEFPGFFDRAYPAGVRAGGVSWVGRDRAGQVVMHVACFPQRFRFGEREVVGGLMMNALVARPYRSFFPAHALIRRAKRDTKARGDIDFVYTDPNEQAKAVMDMCGFVRVGRLTRYVLPVGDRRRLLDGAIRLFHAGVRVVTGSPGAVALVGHPAAEVSTAGFEAPSGDSPRLRPYHGSARYAMRMEGYPGASDWWFTLPRNGDAGALAAGLLVRGPDSSGVADLQAVYRDPGLPLARLIRGLVASLRAKGCTRLQVWTVAESQFAGELRHAGFLPREGAASIVATALTATGESVLRSVRLWEITSLDCDR
ncbi:MAG TPA: hypothetical protein VN953_00960 [Gemmatimonadales bacterium]|nr:hypothetical protein [Gemmatimonadales bacterium]